MLTSSYIVKGETIFHKTTSGIKNIGYLEKVSFNSRSGGFSVIVSNNGTKSFFNTKNLTWEG